ncbi:MAG: TolC family protein [Saprospiraceae bacterium]|nr:TolC family protein [Saprospiraceae bacterium]
MNAFKIQHLTFIIPLLLFVSNGFTQTPVDSVLVNITKNNKSIIANSTYWEAKKLEYKTGLTPYNPRVDYDFLIGTPANAGNQTDFTVTQSFDFPTVYTRKKLLSNEQSKQAEFQLSASRQEILLEAKLISIELVYRNKLNSELSMRKQNTEKWLAAFQTSLDKGQGNIMDVNKARLQLIETNTNYRENIIIINQLNQKLTEFNGGIPIQFTDTAYTRLQQVPDFESLINAIVGNDPLRKFLEQEKVIGRNEISLSKAMTLPKIEAGYHFQAILGQQFNGVHLGMTIPLWENKNLVKTKQAELIMHEANLQDYMNEHYHEIRQKYDRMISLNALLEEYRTLFSTLNNVELLDKSLSFGQITTIEYFLEMSFYYEAINSYLKTEMEYRKLMAELLKYQL